MILKVNVFLSANPNEFSIPGCIPVIFVGKSGKVFFNLFRYHLYRLTSDTAW